MTFVAGVDSSTQSVKVTVHDAATGALVREGSAPHPEGTSCPPQRWWDALVAASAGLLDGVAALSVAGQQHGMVTLDDAQIPVRPALLWNDTRSAASAQALVAELGAQGWAQAVGSVPVASFTVTKLRWLAENEPEAARRVAYVVLPHDYLSLRLAGVLATDRGDASGTGYWSPAAGEYRTDLIRHAFGRDVQVPRVAAPHEVIGYTPGGVLLGPGTGDNMAAALGLGLSAGDVVVSLGTSGTAFAVSTEPTADASGAVAGFADAAGGFLPLVCTLNAARVLTAVAALLGVDTAGFADLALAAPPGAGGLVLLPYLDGERTPDLPDATGSLFGLTRANLTPPNLARAAVEGVLCGLADAVDALRAVGVTPDRLWLIGGAAANPAVQQVAATLFDLEIRVPAPAEYVARGAAWQAAWALGDGVRPQWEPPAFRQVAPAPDPRVREAYEAAAAVCVTAQEIRSGKD
jgi:xylulokinase